MMWHCAEAGHFLVTQRWRGRTASRPRKGRGTLPAQASAPLERESPSRGSGTASKTNCASEGSGGQEQQPQEQGGALASPTEVPAGADDAASDDGMGCSRHRDPLEEMEVEQVHNQLSHGATEHVLKLLSAL